MSLPALPPDTVAVRILTRHHPGALTLHPEAGPTLRLRLVNGHLVLGTRRVATPWTLGGPGFQVEVGPLRRHYPGALRVDVRAGALALTNLVPLEAYTAGVVSAELPSGWPAASLRSQAVLARTLGRTRHDLCDLTHCQSYQGRGRPEAQEAARATQGQLLTYQGRLAQPLYHATCAGHTARNQDIFGGPALPYLQGVADPACADSPHARPWTVRLSGGELSRALGGPVTALAVRDADPAGWVARVRVGDRTLGGYALWQALGREVGWGEVKSLRHTVRGEGESWRFAGRGLGHGVGMCQWGARGRARTGWDHRRILAAFFPGTRVQEPAR